jgi:hypothetical protein
LLRYRERFAFVVTGQTLVLCSVSFRTGKFRSRGSGFTATRGAELPLFHGRSALFPVSIYGKNALGTARRTPIKYLLNETNF